MVSEELTATADDVRGDVRDDGEALVTAARMPSCSGEWSARFRSNTAASPPRCAERLCLSGRDLPETHVPERLRPEGIQATAIQSGRHLQ